MAYFLTWKGLSVAQMRADVAQLLQLPSASRLAAAAAPGAAFPAGPGDRTGGVDTSPGSSSQSIVGRLGARAPGFAV